MNKTKRYQKIKIENLETASSKLEQLESKPQSEFNLRESIYYLRNQLKNALKKGYSYEDLSDILAEQDILVSPATLKQYLNDIYNKSASNQKKNQPSYMKASPKINPHDSQESSRDLSNNTVIQGEKLKLENPLNSTYKAEVKQLSNRTQKKLAKRKAEPAQRVESPPAVLSGSHKDLSHEFNQY